MMRQRERKRRKGRKRQTSRCDGTSFKSCLIGINCAPGTTKGPVYASLYQW